MVKENFCKSIFLSCFLCIFFLYSGFIKIGNRNPYCSIFSTNDLIGIEGKLKSTPIKSSNGKTYSAIMELSGTETDYGKCEASGELNILIPTELVEAFYPGKLYSSAIKKGAYLWEAGGFYKVHGRYKNDCFIISSCKSSYFSSNFFGKIDFFRALCRLQFKRLMYLWGAAGGLLLALLSGAREYTESSVAEAFKNAGLSHILALSGMHLSMFSGIANFIGKKIGIKKLTFIIRIIALIIFVWFAGFSPSLLRAFICSFLILLSALANVENPDMLIILAFSFLLQTIITPQSILNVGFILSYSALAGILIFNTIFQKIYIKCIPKYFANSLASSTSAQIFTIPVSLKIFGSYSPVGIIATTFISPLITIFIYCGLLLIILSMIFPFISVASGFFMNFLYTIIKIPVTFFAKFPGIKII